MVNRNLLRQYEPNADQLQDELNAAFEEGGLADWLPAEEQASSEAGEHDWRSTVESGVDRATGQRRPLGRLCNHFATADILPRRIE